MSSRIIKKEIIEANIINNKNKHNIINNKNVSIPISSNAYIFCKNIKEINKQNKRGYTPIYSSILSNNILSLKELLSLGANPNIPNKLGETPLFLSIYNNNYDIFLLLLKYNADCNMVNKNGDSPLHIAVEKKEIKYIQGLLKNNGDPNIKNISFGQTPTHLAIIHKLDEELLTLFKIYKADIFYIKDKFNKSAFDYAKDNNDEKYRNLVTKIFGYNNNTDININSINNQKKYTYMKDIHNNNIFRNNTDKNKNNINIDNLTQKERKEYSNNNDYYIITTETNKNEFKLENNDSNKENQSNQSLLKNKIILSSDISSENVQIKELNNTFENNSNLNKSKKSLSEFLTEDNNNKNNNKENIDTNGNNVDLNIYSLRSETSEFNKSNPNNVLNRNSENSKNKKHNIVISHSSTSNIYSYKSNNSENNSNANSNVYLTNSVGANKKIIKNIIHDTIKKIIVKSITSSEDNISNLNLLSKDSEQISHINTNSNIEDTKSKKSKNNKKNRNENKENISNNIDKDIYNNIDNNEKLEIEINQIKKNDKKSKIYENGITSFKNKDINEILNNDNITVSKLINDESRTLKISNIYDELYMNTYKTNEMNSENNSINKNDNNIIDNNNSNSNNINTNLNINEIKDNIFTDTTNSNIFSELQIKSNNNYNITNNDISLSYSKNLQTEEENQIKLIENKKEKNIEQNNNKKNKKIISNSNLDIKNYDNYENYDNNQLNNIDNQIKENNINKITNTTIKGNSISNYTITNENINENHVKEKSNGNISIVNQKAGLIKSKSFIDSNKIKNNSKYKIRTHNNSTVEKNFDINEDYNGVNTLLKRKLLNFKNKLNNKNPIYLKHHRQLSYHLNVKSYLNSNKEKNQKIINNNNINDINKFNINNISKENNSPNFTTLYTEQIYKNKNNAKNAWYNNTTNKSFKSTIKSKYSNNLSGMNRGSKFSLSKSGSCQNMNPPPIEAVINKDNYISPTNKTIYSNQNSLTAHNLITYNYNNKLNKFSNTNALLNNTSFTTNKPKNSPSNHLSNNYLKNIPNNNSNKNIKYNILNPYNNFNEDESEESNNNINNQLNKLKNISTNTLIRLREWLMSCDLLCYYNLLISKNMYHIDSYINDIQEGIIPIKYENFERIGIKKPGHIFRLLIKLDIDAGVIDNNLFNYIFDKINYNSVTTTMVALTSSVNETFCCGINLCPNNNVHKKKTRTGAFYFNDLSSFLRAHDIVKFKGNFIHNGFDKIEFVIIQLFSKYAFNKKILNEYLHVYIDRDKVRLLNILYMVKYNIAREFGININENELNDIIYSSHKRNRYNENYNSSQFNNNNNDNSSIIIKENESNHFCRIF